MRLNLKQVCQKYNYSESRVLKNFSEVSKAIKKKYGVDIIKVIIEDEIFYEIIGQERALTIYNEEHSIFIQEDSLSLQGFQFFIFLAIVMMPQGVFRGSQKDFLRYMGLKISLKNIQNLKKAILVLVQKDYIVFNQDRDYIILYVKRKVEKKLWIDINMIRQCRRIVEENHKQICKVPQLIQVWSAIRICQRNQPFTYKDVSKITGLSKKQIMDVKKLLQKSNVFKVDRAGSRYKCLGMNVDLNAFFPSNYEGK